MAGLKGTSGSSAGALTALVLYLGMDTKTVEGICMHLLGDISNVLSHPDIGNLVEKYGIGSCAYMRSIISSVLRAAGLCEDATFVHMDRLIRKEFACTGTNLNTRRGEIFSSKTTPNMKVVDAIVISMSIPILFPPLQHNGDLYVDGSLTITVPHDLFDDAETEFWLIKPTARMQIASWRDFLISLTELTTAPFTQLKQHRETLWIAPVGSSPPFDFLGESARNMTQVQILAGYQSAMAHMFPHFSGTVAALVQLVAVCRRLNDENDASGIASGRCTEEEEP